MKTGIDFSYLLSLGYKPERICQSLGYRPGQICIECERLIGITETLAGEFICECECFATDAYESVDDALKVWALSYKAGGM